MVDERRGFFREFFLGFLEVLFIPGGGGDRFFDDFRLGVSDGIELGSGDPRTGERFRIPERNPPTAVSLVGVRREDSDSHIIDRDAAARGGEALERAYFFDAVEVRGHELAEHFLGLGVGALGAIDPDFDTGRVFGVAVDIEFEITVRAEGQVGDIFEFSGVDDRGGDLLKSFQPIQEKEVVGRHPPRRERALFEKEVSEGEVAFRRVVDALDIVFRDRDMASVPHHDDGIFGLGEDLAADFFARVEKNKVRRPIGGRIRGRGRGRS